LKVVLQQFLSQSSKSRLGRDKTRKSRQTRRIVSLVVCFLSRGQEMAWCNALTTRGRRPQSIFVRMARKARRPGGFGGGGLCKKGGLATFPERDTGRRWNRNGGMRGLWDEGRCTRGRTAVDLPLRSVPPSMANAETVRFVTNALATRIQNPCRCFTGEQGKENTEPLARIEK